MRKITLLIVVTFAFSKMNYGQLINISKTEIQEIKNSTLNFVETDNLEYDSLLKFAVKEYWTFSKYKFISSDEYKKLRYVDNNYFVSMSNYSTSLNKTSKSAYAYDYYFKVLTISKSRTKPKKEEISIDIPFSKCLVSVLNPQSTPTFNDNSIFVYDIIYKLALDVKSLQFLLEYSQVDKNIGMVPDIKYVFPKIEDCKKSTLYILKRDVFRKMDIEDIRRVYNYNVEIISEEELNEIINAEEKNALYFSWIDLGTKRLLSLVNISDGAFRYSWTPPMNQLDQYIFNKLNNVIK